MKSCSSLCLASCEIPASYNSIIPCGVEELNPIIFKNGPILFFLTWFWVEFLGFRLDLHGKILAVPKVQFILIILANFWTRILAYFRFLFPFSSFMVKRMLWLIPLSARLCMIRREALINISNCTRMPIMRFLKENLMRWSLKFLMTSSLGWTAIPPRKLDHKDADHHGEAGLFWQVTLIHVSSKCMKGSYDGFIL